MPHDVGMKLIANSEVTIDPQIYDIPEKAKMNAQESKGYSHPPYIQTNLISVPNVSQSKELNKTTINRMKCVTQLEAAMIQKQSKKFHTMTDSLFNTQLNNATSNMNQEEIRYRLKKFVLQDEQRLMQNLSNQSALINSISLQQNPNFASNVLEQIILPCATHNAIRFVF